MHLPNPVVRSHYRNGFIKQYVRDHLILRTEAATNNVNDYGVNKAVENLPAAGEARRLSSTPTSTSSRTLETSRRSRSVAQARRADGPSRQAHSGLRLDHPRQLALMQRWSGSHTSPPIRHSRPPNCTPPSSTHSAVRGQLHPRVVPLRSVEAPCQGSYCEAPRLSTLSTPSAGLLGLARLPEALRAGLCSAHGRSPPSRRS